MTDARASALMQARIDGRAAKPGASNPYAGDDYPLARMWRLGYKAMLLDMLNSSPAAQAFTRENSG